jgi:hypothetical protein
MAFLKYLRRKTRELLFLHQFLLTMNIRLHNKNIVRQIAAGLFSQRFKLFPLCYCVFFLTVRCNNPTEKATDVSNINVQLKTYRFDKDFFSMDTAHISEGLKKLDAKYPDFLNYYLDTFMTFGIKKNYSDTGLPIRRLDTFLTYKDFAGLEDTIKKYYPDSKETDEALTKGFRYIKYYLPDATVPRIIYINSGLSNWPAFPLDNNTLCIGLDWFLGDQFPFYRSVGVPSYMAAHQRKSYLPVSAFNAIYMAAHPFAAEDKNLLDLMIQRGKEQYFLHKILPGTPDSVLFGFTGLQVSWCGSNEAFVYNFLIHQGLLYSKDVHNIMPYVTDGPFALGLEPVTDPVKTTPGNVGAWLGYRIVCSYMAQHPHTTLQQLLTLQTDAAKFLDDAHYRPK